MNDQTYLSSSSSSSGDSATNPPTDPFGSGAANDPQTIWNTLFSGWDNPSQINNPVVSEADNVPQSIILFRPGGAHNTAQTTNNSLSHAAGIRLRAVRPDKFDPFQLPSDDDEITAPEIPTHDPDFLEEDEDDSNYELIGDIFGDFDVDRLGWEWMVEEDEGQARPFPPGYFERLEAELDDIIAGRYPQHPHGSDSDREVGYVTEVEDIVDETRDSDEDTALDEA
ncbi:hypothetical protein N7447_001840 [Penicillium robsamsonii]|uniref:uncharacterized protein n=1 Tax=Penicillium robsamsonii TaxID=1792511 RepID=UPI002548D3B2|nr:uncharacterized protein N7447_001840 [Penicillium robsamsonii]KAJ5835814.1 hypothetical protein N7447_001840 [Penicillium robsamsonii]